MQKPERLLEGNHPWTQLLDKVRTGKQSSSISFVVWSCMNVCRTKELTRGGDVQNIDTRAFGEAVDKVRNLLLIQASTSKVALVTQTGRSPVVNGHNRLEKYTVSKESKIIIKLGQIVKRTTKSAIIAPREMPPAPQNASQKVYLLPR